MITLEKAIRRLQRYIKWRKPEPGDNFNEAVALGIEAIKREQLLRHEIPYDRGGLLPGETLE